MDNNNNEEYVIQKDGRILHRKYLEQEVSVTAEIAAAFSTNANHELKNVINMSEFGFPDYGLAAVSINNRGSHFWSVRVLNLIMNCPFKMKGKHLVPDFTSTDKPMSLKWKVEEPMKIMLGVFIEGQSSGKHYLLTYDSIGRHWRLPLSNLYENCELCHGQSIMSGITDLNILAQVLKNFSASQWQADLSNLHLPEQTESMFAFTPTNEGFDQYSLIKNYVDWTKFCKKVSNSVLNERMILS